MRAARNHYNYRDIDENESNYEKQSIISSMAKTLAKIRIKQAKILLHRVKEIENELLKK